MANNSRASLKIAQRYAKALFETGEFENVQEEIAKDASLIEQFINEDKDFNKLITSPLLNPNDQERLIKSIFFDIKKTSTKINRFLYAFLATVGKNGRLAILLTILKEYSFFISKKNNEKEVLITSAIELDDKTKEEIKNDLSKRLSKKVFLTHKIDTEILGGIVMQIDSKLIDCSVRYKVNKLKYAMKGLN